MMEAERNGASIVWHALPVETVLRHAGSDGGRGLSLEEATRRVARYGPNALPEAKRRPLFVVFLHQFKSPLIYLLFAAGGDRLRGRRME